MRCVVWQRDEESREAQDKVEFVCILFWVVRIFWSVWCGWFSWCCWFFCRFSGPCCDTALYSPCVCVFSHKSFFSFNFYSPSMHSWGRKNSYKTMEKYCELKWWVYWAFVSKFSGHIETFIKVRENAVFSRFFHFLSVDATSKDLHCDIRMRAQGSRPC